MVVVAVTKHHAERLGPAGLLPATPVFWVVSQEAQHCHWGCASTCCSVSGPRQLRGAWGSSSSNRRVGRRSLHTVLGRGCAALLRSGRREHGEPRALQELLCFCVPFPSSSCVWPQHFRLPRSSSQVLHVFQVKSQFVFPTEVTVLDP